MFKNENEPNDFILASGYHTYTQKVSKWFKPPTLWNGLKTQLAGWTPKGQESMRAKVLMMVLMC